MKSITQININLKLKIYNKLINNILINIKKIHVFNKKISTIFKITVSIAYTIRVSLYYIHHHNIIIYVL